MKKSSLPLAALAVCLSLAQLTFSAPAVSSRLQDNKTGHHRTAALEANAPRSERISVEAIHFETKAEIHFALSTGIGTSEFEKLLNDSLAQGAGKVLSRKSGYLTSGEKLEISLNQPSMIGFGPAPDPLHNMYPGDFFEIVPVINLAAGEIYADLSWERDITPGPNPQRETAKSTVSFRIGETVVLAAPAAANETTGTRSFLALVVK